ncbi:hypothetical protein PC41400_14755 [Paenibacillus chitinolyticus]|uniref:Uncharacterized protein n=1 Tax=Paenibacillus chitinolyticus TaxID=79263 RepID=A0A410WWN9_9BACL|nr:hypothetical protein [Paenibacillus chitinolyticus]MCY9593967.1 hypothetical protein [Paenibacillus chitinolyticus]MCY9599622.1 hypothetical protein [Paenibacillus chitinolyticus]QAV18869.1 hypothetical protein PC41400_14755 [Paenibacillus chitinolyticus]
MIYSVHCYFHKINSRKAGSKFEGIVFAKNKEHAEEIVRALFSKYPIEIESMSAVGREDRTLDEVYTERPELIGISPERGYLYNEYTHKVRISKYAGK